MPNEEGADVVVAVNGENAGQNQNQGFRFLPILKSIAMRLIMFYLVSSLMRYSFDGKIKLPGTNQSEVYPPSENMFKPGEFFDMYFFLSPEAEKFTDFSNKDAVSWLEKDLMYGDWSSGDRNDGSRSKHLSLPTPIVLQNNGSLYLHVFAVKSGKSIVPEDDDYAGEEIVHGSVMLNKYKKKQYKRTANLLTGKTNQTEEEKAKAELMDYEVLNYWHENITVNLVTDNSKFEQGKLPSPLSDAVKFAKNRSQYYPILFFNNYWNLGSEYQIVNETVPSIDLTVTYAPMSLFKWQMYASQQVRNDDQDAIKQALLETNPVLLGVTVVVSILHTVLEFLAFKNDVQFWRERKSLEGLSVRSVLSTSWVIKLSVAFGLLIELWKIPKVLNVQVSREEKWFGVIPKIKFSDKGSYVKSATKEYDELAFKYLSWLLFPLLAAYAGYSLVYEEQHGWYSWVLDMLYGFLLMFGFIMMTPQLFINYKLKSVAHLPWRMLTYKFVNTFIDDLFAFVIKMPTMYRIGCFRDDIVFLVYIYQRWAYRVDPERINEFGVSLGGPNGALLVDELDHASVTSAEDEMPDSDIRVSSSAESTCQEDNDGGSDDESKKDK
uniref:Cleft lip and palate associated transmembrane protein n=1 Tax=Ditylenchus dipsaci TaxID=166011 RepID=A0A915DJ93_9BILA